MNKRTPSIYVSEYRLQGVDTVTCIFEKVQTRETCLKLSFEKLFGFFGISFTKEYFDRLEIENSPSCRDLLKIDLNVRGVQIIFFIMKGNISFQPEDLFGSSAFLTFKAC